MSTQQCIENGSTKRVLRALLLCGTAFFGIVPVGFGATAPTATPQVPYQGLFRSPTRAALDASGTLYVTDSRAGQLIKLSTAGTTGAVLTVKSNLTKPLAVAAGNQGLIYVSEEDSGRVLVFNSALTNALYSLGSGSNEFQLATHIAVDNTVQSNGWIYVSDSRANQIKCYSNSTLVKTFGTKGSGNGQFDFPVGLYVSPSRELFVVDQNNDRVQVFNSTGAFQRVFSLRTAADLVTTNIYGRAQGITGDAAGRVYVTDAYQGEVKVFDGTSGTSLTNISSMGEWIGQLRTPGAVALGSDQRLFVASLNNNRIEVFGLQGGFAVSVSIQVVSAYGTPVPAVGTYLNVSGTVLTNFVSATDIRGQTQYVCTGWTLTGNAPASGTTNSMTMTHTNNAVLEWNWKTQYILTVTSGANGSASPASSWWDTGATATATATASNYYHFAQWTGSSTSTTNPLSILMSSPKSVGALFAANLATNSTPEWWLASFPTLAGATFDAKALGDQDNDGMFTWQEYVADTIPTNPLSYLAFSALNYTPSGVEITWHGGVLATQILYRATSLTGTPVWTGVFTNRPPTLISMTFTNAPGTNTSSFYKIGVTR